MEIVDVERVTADVVVDDVDVVEVVDVETSVVSRRTRFEKKRKDQNR